MLIPDIRPLYSSPRRDCRLANPGKIPTCVQVAVRPETTVFAHETMLDSLPQRPARRARLARLGQLDVHNPDASRTGLVLDKGLQLPKRSAMEPGALTLAGLDPVADMVEVFHHDPGDLMPDRLLDDGLARFVVDLLDAPPLFAGDLPKLLFGALAAACLPQRARRRARNRSRLWRGFPPLKTLPLLVAARLFSPTSTPITGPDATVFTSPDSTTRLKNHLPLRKTSSAPFGWPDSRMLCLADREDGVAAHLAAQRCLSSQLSIGQMVQRHTVPDAMLANDENEAVAGVGISRLQRSEPIRLLCRDIQLDRRCTHHRLSPLGELLGALDISATAIAGGMLTNSWM